MPETKPYRPHRRCGLLLALSLVATIVGMAAPRVDARTQASRPNVVWFISDDLSPYLGAYGDPVARTPTIDRLAATGLRFDVAWADAPVCAPSRFALLTGLYSATAGPAHHMRATATLPALVRGFPEVLRQAGYYTVNNSKTDYNADVDMAATWDASGPQAHWRDRPAGAPFFAQFTTLTTHEISLVVRRPEHTRPGDVVIPAFTPDTPATRTDKAHYYDRAAEMDGELAQRLAELEADGLAEDTIVFYLSDNGGVLPWSKRFANDRGLRVPLVVHVPEKWRDLAPAPAGSVVQGPINFVDLPATVLALAGVRAPRHLQGTARLGRTRRKATYAYGQRSRMDERYDLVRTVRDRRWMYVRNYLPHRPHGQHVAFMWQQQGYREWERLHLDGQLTAAQERFWQEKPAEELYDLDADPEQLENLVAVPAHAKTLRRLRRVLDRHLRRINDNGFIPEGSPPEGYAASRVRGAYALPRVMRVARIAIARDPSRLRTLVARLDDDDAVVRYWAALGVLMLHEAGAPATPALTARLAGDASVHVRIAAAEALARLGDGAAPVAFLAATVDTHADPRARLLALNALTALPVDLLLPHAAVIERAALDPDEYLANAGRYLRAVVAGTYDPLAPP